MLGFKIEGKSATPSKKQVWYFQYEGKRIKKIRKLNGQWYFDDKSGLNVSCDTLSAAKQELRMEGARVWSELQ